MQSLVLWGIPSVQIKQLIASMWRFDTAAMSKRPLSLCHTKNPLSKLVVIFAWLCEHPMADREVETAP